MLNVLTQDEADDLGLALVMDENGNVSIIDLLRATDAMAARGLLYDTNTSDSLSIFELTLRSLANDLYSAINEGSDI